MLHYSILQDRNVIIDESTPYANLTPELILAAVESIGFHCSGSLFALNSYENRVYQVGIDDGDPIIAKFYRPHRWEDKAILEEHQFALDLLAREIPVIAPIVHPTGETLHHYQGYCFAVFLRKGGRALELENLDQLEWMGRFIGRLHAVGSIQPYQHRPKLDPKTHGYIPFQFLLDNHFIPSFLQENYRRTLEEVLTKIDTCFQSVASLTYIRLHGDCHAGNVLWRDTGPHIVDLDDSVMGPAIQDIWMLLSGNEQQIALQLNLILEGYQEFHDFDFREIRLIEALRTLRMIQYSAWLANRWDDPAFPKSFPWFNTPHYWQEQLHHLMEQSLALDSLDRYCFRSLL